MTPEQFQNLSHAFAMVALAKVSNWPREKLSTLPSEFKFVPLPKDIASKLRERVANGDVTCIVPSPEPFTWITVKCSTGKELRTIYGLWVGRAASWRGKIDPTKIPHLAMTTEEAEERGIPVPALSNPTNLY